MKNHPSTDSHSPESGPSNRPLLILLHGTRMNTGQWATYPAMLDDLVEVLAPDLAGHGRREGEPFSVAQTLDDVNALIDERPGRPVILGGYSMGGYLALHYAEHYPERLSGLVLIGAATEPGGLKSWICRRVADAWEGVGLQGMKWIDRMGFAPICDPRLWRAIQQHGGQFRKIRHAWDDVMDGCSAQQLAALHCPVLIMSGRIDPLHWQAGHFANATRQAQIISAPKRTHFWPLTRPDEVAQAMRGWLVKEVMARTSSTAARG
ncbi:MAG: alpha/beta hydrolase [Lautropia sp.]|nr:alpha/beta hydrolase [Lautropia sp.]